MQVNQTCSFGIGVELGLPFDTAVETVKRAFQAEGFGTLTSIDVQKTLKEKIGTEMEPYVILGVCNPNLASRSIAAEHQSGLLLPCNILVHQCGDKIHVDAQDPAKMLGFVGNPSLEPIGREARERIHKALASLTDV